MTWRLRILGWLYAWLLRLQQMTWRIDMEGLERLDRRLVDGEKTLITFWHGKYVALFVLLRGRRGCVFTSQSFRGGVIAEICRRFNYSCVQIPNHERDRSLALMRRALTSHRVGAVAVDGPLGPDHVVKRGAIQLASELGFALLPVSVDFSRKRVLKDRWDHMEIPRLWTRVSVVFGNVLEVPSRLTQSEVDLWASRLHDALDSVDRRAKEKVNTVLYRDPQPESQTPS